MTIAQDLEGFQVESIIKSIESLPSDLGSQEPSLESYLHLQQLVLLMKCLDWLWQDRDDYFAAGNLTIYYSRNRKKNEDFRGPDFFVVLNTEHKPRKSWMIWEEEGKYPNVIIELLSDSTANIDRGAKKQIYQDTFRTPEYFWFHPDTLEFQGFELIRGKYQPIQANESGLIWSEQLQLFLGTHENQLRFFTADQKLTPTPEEFAAEVQAKNERLAAKLRELNIDPDTL